VDYARRYAPLAVLLLLLPATWLSPNPSEAGESVAGGQEPTVSVQVNVVNVLATVRTKHGETVRNLTKDDFALEDDGRPQNITYFSRETDLPLTLGLLVDTSLSQRHVLDQERDASHTFLDQVLRVDKDKAFVIHFDHEVELLQDLTSSSQKLNAALELLATGDRGAQDSGDPSGGQSGSPRHAGHWGGGTLLYDAIYLASNEEMKKLPGRKAVIVLSDGVDRGSKETEAGAIEAAQRADTLVYSILFKDEPQYGQGGFGGPGMGRHGGRYPRYPQESRPDGKKVLERIAKQTGGRLFEISKKQPLDQIYNQVEDELRSQYSLGFSPDADVAAPGYHKLVVTARGKDLIVQARDGYYNDHLTPKPAPSQ
jgi:VWFA-related protein